MKRRRILLLGVAGFLSLTALLAVVILLVGRFGTTEQRILGTTMLLAAFGVVALPSVVLLDQGRFRRLALAAAASAAVGAALAISAIWSGSDSETLGRCVGTATVLAIALAQTAALAARRRDDDQPAVRRLFAAACVLAAVAAAAAIALLWTNPNDPLYARLLGAVVVLDLLAAVLQPLLARARPVQPAHRFRISLASGETLDVEIVGGDVATAAARAIRATVHGGADVVRLEISDGARTRT